MKQAILILAALIGLRASVAAEDPKKSAADLGKQVKKAVDTGKEEEALQKVRELGAIHTAEAVKALFDIGVGIQLPKVYKEVAAQLSKMTEEEPLKALEAEAKSPNEARKMFLTDVLAEMKSPRAIEILASMSEEKNQILQLGVVSALQKQRSKGSIEPLLKMLERLDAVKDRGRVYQDIRDALFDLTGKDYDVVADWKKWWDVSKATFEPDKKPEGPTQLRPQSRDAAPEFAGRKILSKNVVFVIDSSGSMMYVVKDDIPGLSAGDGSDKGGKQRNADEKLTKENERLAKFWTRMEMAKRALLKAIMGFDQRARINIVEFNTKVRRFEKSLFVASPEMKKKSTDWVRKMNWVPNGQTDTMAAVEEAFACDRSTTEIYLLSDGLPSKDGKRNDPTEPILERVEALNRFRKIKIYTFGFDPLMLREGVESPDLVGANKFLEKLAKRTGGTFTLLKVTDEKPPKDFHAR